MAKPDVTATYGKAGKNTVHIDRGASAASTKRKINRYVGAHGGSRKFSTRTSKRGRR